MIIPQNPTVSEVAGRSRFWFPSSRIFVPNKKSGATSKAIKTSNLSRHKYDFAFRMEVALDS